MGEALIAIRAAVWGWGQSWAARRGLDRWAVQFCALYRVFLLRVIDLELLSSDADPSKLMGQFASVLVTISFYCAIPTIFILMAGGTLSMTAGWTSEHFFIETTMTVAGLIAVLNWESAFPDRRDVLVLGPLPVRTGTLVLAKAAALFAGPLLAMVALNLCIGFTWSLVFAPKHSGLPGMERSLVAYWITIALGGAFLVFTVMAVQGLVANLLPRQIFLRVSAVLQAGALCLLLSTYFLEPSLESVKALTAPANQRLLAWLPSYWFLGLFQELNGSTHPAMAGLAQRAWVEMAVSAMGAGLALVLAYFRMMPKIVEQAEIQPLTRGHGWGLGLGSSLRGTITLFSVRTLLRSRQHRMILSFYVGIGMALMVGYFKMPFAPLAVTANGIGRTLLVGSTLMMILVVLALRVVATIPISLGANWVVRVTQVRPAPGYRHAVRATWLMLGVVPVWLAVAGYLLGSHVRGWPALGHLGMLALLGVLVVELCLQTFQKIPFTCSYLPGKGNLHFAFWASLAGFIWLVNEGTKLESRLLQRVSGTLWMLVVLAVLALVARGATEVRMRGEEELVFEEAYEVQMVSLDLR
jgi:hypothetical protein